MVADTVSKRHLVQRGYFLSELEETCFLSFAVGWLEWLAEIGIGAIVRMTASSEATTPCTAVVLPRPLPVPTPSWAPPPSVAASWPRPRGSPPAGWRGRAPPSSPGTASSAWRERGEGRRAPEETGGGDGFRRRADSSNGSKYINRFYNRLIVFVKVPNVYWSDALIWDLYSTCSLRHCHRLIACFTRKEQITKSFQESNKLLKLSLQMWP